jgi:hypothetical protein
MQHPYSLAQTPTHPLARMLPLGRPQMQVYRLGEKHPPIGELVDHAPMWECATFVLGSRGSDRVRINLQRDFTLLAITASASVNTALGGFRAQFYDTVKEQRFADRGVLLANLAGGAKAPMFLREPYPFDQPDSQILVVAQNMENATNNIQVVFYGVVLRFNQPVAGQPDYPGGVVSNYGG